MGDRRECVLPAILFFFNDTATTEIYTLSLHDALPICFLYCPVLVAAAPPLFLLTFLVAAAPPLFILSISRCGSAPAFYTADRKSTRLNSSHRFISYAVFCLKKKKTTQPISGRLPLSPPSLQQCKPMPASQPASRPVFTHPIRSTRLSLHPCI